MLVSNLTFVTLLKLGNIQISGYGSLLRVIMNNVVYKVVSFCGLQFLE